MIINKNGNSNFRVVSEQFKQFMVNLWLFSSFRAVLEQFQSSFRAVSYIMVIDWVWNSFWNN